MGQMRRLKRGIARKRAGGDADGARSVARGGGPLVRAKKARRELQARLAAYKTLAAIRKAAKDAMSVPHPAGGESGATGATKRVRAEAKRLMQKVVGPS